MMTIDYKRAITRQAEALMNKSTSRAPQAL